MDPRMRGLLGKVERGVRPRAVAALREAHHQARAADAAEQGNALLAQLVAEVRTQGERIDQLEAVVRRLAGEEPRPDAGPTNDRYDRQTEAVLRRVLRPGDTCIDVGANEGLILAQMLELAPQGRHHAFEPIPAMAEALRARFPSVDVHEVALAAEAGESTFTHVVSNPSYSGLRERRYDNEGETLEQITVRTARLDDELPSDTSVRVLKIDVEGGEEGVLRGALGVLERCRPFVVFEHGLGAADHYGTTPETIHGLLTGCGLAVTLLERWLDDGPPLEVADFVDEFASGRNYYFLAYPAA